MMSLSKVVVTTVAAAVELTATAEGKARQADFDGDGRADLVISVTGEAVAGQGSAGAVAVIYGKDSGGLDASGDQLWTLDSAGVNGLPQPNGQFGGALAVGDYDNDGYSDLAIASPLADVGVVASAGMVTVLYGRSSGLSSAGDQLWHLEVSGVIGSNGQSNFFGRSLAAGDFDGDGRDDLAIGTPGQDVGGTDSAGEVHVLYGSGSGLRASGDQVLNQDTEGLGDAVEEDDHFGFELAAGDYDGDGKDDLAIGTPEDDIDANNSAGVVNVVYGTSNGLDGEGSDTFAQGAGGLPDSAEANDRFGEVMTSGDFDNNGKDDLAIGVYREDVGGALDAGAVHVLYGSSSGLRTNNDDFWTQDVAGVNGAAESFDWFGQGLAAGDFDGDGKDDLAIGIPGEFDAIGAVYVLYGGSGGLTTSGDEVWNQDSTGIKGTGELNDALGTAVAAGDFDDDGRDDLAIGVIGQTVGGESEAGAVNVIYGSSGGLAAGGNQNWHQDTSGINDVPAEGERFGEVLR